MIFAHGPLGFLSSSVARPLWRRWKISARLQKWLPWIGFFGGIFPDSDLFFFYLVDATRSHREFLSHVPIVYVGVGLALMILTYFFKKYAWFVVALAFISGTMSHLLSDMIVAEVRFLYPFSKDFYGLGELNIPFFSDNILFANFLVEGIIITFFLYALIRLTVKNFRLRIGLVTLLLCVFTGGVAYLITWNKHAYHAPRGLKYEDIDHDGVLNYQDEDMDGDGVRNLTDRDSDGDGVFNVVEIMEQAERFDDVWYDPTDGGFIQVPSRLGFLTTDDSVRRLYETVGIPFHRDMQADYAVDTEGYVLSSRDESFDRTAENFYAWLNHEGVMETGDALDAGRHQIGDILFFESGHIGVVTGFSLNAEPLLLDVHKNRRVQERAVEAVESLEGPAIARAKMLDSSVAP